MTGSRCLAIAALCAAMATGCAQAPPTPVESRSVTEAPTEQAAPQPPPPAPAPRVSDSDRLLYYYGYILSLHADELARELERTQRFFGQHRSGFALLQLVLIKTLPGASAKERAQGLEMLTQYLKETRDASSELQPFALLLSNLLTDQQRQDVELQALTQKLKDETRRSEELRQKLDALVETERKMLERKQPTRKE